MKVKKKLNTKKKIMNKKLKEITDYDTFDTSDMVNKELPITFKDLGLILPETPPTQVISIRLPSDLVNEIKALGSQNDVPYQALIKLFLRESVDRKKKVS